MGRGNKILPKHRGPYQVRGRKQSIYFIEALSLDKQIKTHVHNLRPFLFSPGQVNPIEVAQQNEQEFMVRDIIAHRGDHHRRSSMEFLVRWTVLVMMRVPIINLSINLSSIYHLSIINLPIFCLSSIHDLSIINL